MTEKYKNAGEFVNIMFGADRKKLIITGYAYSKIRDEVESIINEAQSLKFPR